MRNGAILPLTALMAVFLLGMVALVADVGNFYYHRLKLQTAINAAWKAGFDRLMALKSSSSDPIGPNQVKVIDGHIREILTSNGFDQTQLQTIRIEISEDNLLVSCQQKVNYIFGRVLELDSSIISDTREAYLSFTGVVPLAIHHGLLTIPQTGRFSFKPFDNDSCFEPGLEYILSPGGPADTITESLEPAQVRCSGAFVSDSMNIKSEKDLELGFMRSLYRKIDIGNSLQPAFFTFSPAETLRKRLANNASNDNSRKIIVPIIETFSAKNASESQPVTIYNLPTRLDQAASENASAASDLKIIGFAEFAFLFPEESENEMAKKIAAANQSTSSDVIIGKFLRYIVKPGTVKF